RVPLAPGAAERTAAAVAPPPDAALVGERRAIVTRLLDGEGGLLPEIKDAAARARVLDAAATGDLRAALVAGAPSPEEGGAAGDGFAAQWAVAARFGAASDALPTLGATLPPEYAEAARAVLADLLPANAVAPLEHPLTLTLTGEPMVNRGFSRSIAHNQQRSL